jgi:integrase/recombinase XerD
VTPLTAGTAASLRAWVQERRGQPSDPLFPTSRGRRLSRDTLERRLAKHVAIASAAARSLDNKRITLHVLRHTAAMRLLQAGVDTTVIALWLGHESVDTTQIYLHAHLALKERARAHRTAGQPARALPAARHPARLPRRSVTPSAAAPRVRCERVRGATGDARCSIKGAVHGRWRRLEHAGRC